MSFANFNPSEIINEYENAKKSTTTPCIFDDLTSHQLPKKK